MTFSYIFQVIIPHHLFGPLDYSYLGDSPPTIGAIVQVPFRSKTLLGLVVGKETATIASEKIRPLQLCSDLLPLAAGSLRFLSRAAQYYVVPQGAIWKLMAPSLSMWLEKQPEPAAIISNPAQAVALSVEQNQALQELLPHFLAAKFSVTLLDGVTGSGKTEVYAEAIIMLLEGQSGQVLLLLPEIALTPQLTKRLALRLGEEPAIWHSDLTPKQRLKTITNIINGSAKLVIGARSAVFLPFPNLLGIVVDEEHEAAYKQEDDVLYQGRDMAVLRAQCENIPIVLTSATPSLETLYHAMQGRYQHIKLPSRHGAGELPQVRAIDMRQVTEKGSAGWISPRLRAALSHSLATGKQAMLFLNRRGYAPLSLCRSCGFRITCPDCAVNLVEHRHPGQDPQLLCHHCGYHTTITKSCPECQADAPLLPIGPGVERLNELVMQYFPEARTLTLSRDTMTTVKKISAAMDSILAGEVDIIIGTQMIAKGHNFPAVECVGIIDADLGLFGMDLRAAERSFQLLHQVGGRAGRHSSDGEVWLQSYIPFSPLVQSLLDNDRDSFVKLELEQRQASHMPPFSKLAAIILSGRDEHKVAAFAKRLCNLLPVQPGIDILGPTPAPLAFIKQRYRYRLLIRATNIPLLQPYLQYLTTNIQLPPFIEMRIDVDPYNFM